jgi:molecular chaperone DnaK (HSP70)
MKASAFFGIDLGTTQSSVAYVLDSPRIRAQKVVDPQMVPLDSSRGLGGYARETFQSVVGIDPGDKRRSRLLFGSEFLDTFSKRRRTPALRRGRDLFTSVKSDMGTGRVYAFSRCRDVELDAKLHVQPLHHGGHWEKEVKPR